MNELQAAMLKQVIDPDMLGDCEIFMKVMLPEDCKEMQRLDMLTAYWSGAATLSVILRHAEESGNFDSANKALDQISTQMEKYSQRLIECANKKLESAK